MDETMRAQAAELRIMPSKDAADWLLRHHPVGGYAIGLLEHATLRSADNRRLAKHYLAGPSHAHDRAYRLFARGLGLTGLVRILGETQDRDARDCNLLAYHLKHLLRDAKDDKELRLVENFIESLSSS